MHEELSHVEGFAAKLAVDRSDRGGVSKIPAEDQTHVLTKPFVSVTVSCTAAPPGESVPH